MTATLAPEIREAMVSHLTARIEMLRSQEVPSLVADLSNALDSLGDGREPNLDLLKRIFEDEYDESARLQATPSTGELSQGEEDAWKEFHENNMKMLLGFMEAVG